MVVYTSEELKAYNVCLRPTLSVLDMIRTLGIGPARRHRGRRAGRRRSRPVLERAANGVYVFLDHSRSRPPPKLQPSRAISLRRIKRLRYSCTSGNELTFGFLNIRSLTHKFDDLMEVCDNQAIRVISLCETWHDPESAWIGRLHSDGWQVVEKSRPRPPEDKGSLATNHGGVAICAAPGVRLVNINIPMTATTFEFVCARVSSGTSCVLAVVYRPGSASVTQSFFQELTVLLGELASLREPVYLAGDLNVRLERDDDDACHQLKELLATYNFAYRATGPTHHGGGTLDVLAFQQDISPPPVSVCDVGLSDHCLLKWNASLTRPRPIYATVNRRTWSKLDPTVFRAELLLSPLASAEAWSALDVESMAQLYNREITRVLDKLIPMKTVKCRRRSSDPWFDEECRTAKRKLRKAERRARRAPSMKTEASVNDWTTQRRTYRRLLSRKREVFWCRKVETERATPRRLWQSLDTLLGRGLTPLPESLSAGRFAEHFREKVSSVWTATATHEPPNFSEVTSGCSLSAFRTLTVEDITAEIRSLPDKCCASDPLPTRMLRECSDILAPFITELINRSLLLGEVPQTFKAAIITPRIKKPGLDASDVRSYRPISNLSVLSKLLERMVSKQLTDYLASSGLLPELQSAYRAHHSTETAVLKVTTDILRELDAGKLAVLVLLDLTAAFDTVDHAILLRRLMVSYGISNVALRWFSSYLDHRTQRVRCPNSNTCPSYVTCGVPQGSVLGPILFALYVADLVRITQKHELRGHLYADDTQVYGGCWPTETQNLLARLTQCLEEMAVWLNSNRLQLNAAKTEVLWLATDRQQHLLPSSCVRINDLEIRPVSSVRNLGIYLDSAATMKLHVAKMVASCFASLRLIRSLRRSVTQAVLKSLVVALVLTRLDYGNATLAGSPAHLLGRLQSVLNGAARLIHRSARCEHVTPLLVDLHWLSVPERVKYKLSTLAYRCLHGIGPSYLATELSSVADLECRRRLRSATTAALIVPRTRLVTVGDRAFPVAAARAWNSLPADIQRSPSFDAFKERLKSWLFRTSYN